MSTANPIPMTSGARKQRVTRARPNGWRSARAFTLIELLVVIAIIALIAGMIMPVTGAINRNKVRAKARVELAQVRMAIEAYKSKMGHYPPDNPGYPYLSQLYYELLGTTNWNNTYITLDGGVQLPAGGVNGIFGVGGFVNNSQPGGGDEVRTANAFLRQLKQGQYADITVNGVAARILTCSIPWTGNSSHPGLSAKPGFSAVSPPTANPFRYNSSNPVNNPSSFDLSVDVMIGGKTNRISNWSRDPIVVGAP
jgi:prepilin-type N-terminal cleavage/methylation domain-containing protein